MSVSPGQRFGSYEIVAIIGAGETACFAIRSPIKIDLPLRLAARGRDRGEGASR
jgi:hypothetical protein